MRDAVLHTTSHAAINVIVNVAGDLMIKGAAIDHLSSIKDEIELQLLCLLLLLSYVSFEKSVDGFWILIMMKVVQIDRYTVSCKVWGYARTIGTWFAVFTRT